jgi:tetratricopeptide (TPR) repeat protein
VPAANALRRVFVVMPFGKKEVPKTPKVEAPAEGKGANEPLKVDFDAVYEKLFAPALRAAECVPFRATDEKGAGDIRKDMFFELVTADLVLADISILNANVFYELGVRHGVAPRGVISIHAGWSDRPFDVAPDRTFKYNGQLFIADQKTRDAAWEENVKTEVDQLAATLRDAIAEDEQAIGSPVYSMVDGLKPVDWSGISTARSNYFKKLSDDWRQRVKVARKDRHPGDILTLAGDMPTRLHRKKLLWECARALVELHRFEQARGVLEELLEMDRDNFDAQSFLALVDNRLGRSASAEESLDALVAARPGDGEAQGMLGRVYKDLWRVAWKEQSTLEERQSVAMENAVIAAKAIVSYERALRQNLSNYYNGINVVSLQSLLDFLAEKTGSLPADTGVSDLPELISVVSVATRQALKNPNELAWAAPTLGELELIRGNSSEALRRYQQAANAPGAPYFEIDSMLSQLRLFEGLGFRAEAVAPVVKLLERKLTQLGNPLPTFGKVVVCSGHMIDRPERVNARFPAGKEPAVRDKIAALLGAWGLGKGDLAISGGACGSDILFAEECQRRGASVRLMLALPRADFVSTSVAFAGNDWVQRFYQLANTCEVVDQSSRLGKPPADLDVFGRCNLWMLNTARVEVGLTDHLFAVLIWDEKPTGDGPGGTSDFAARIRDLGGVVEIINPTKLVGPGNF